MDMTHVFNSKTCGQAEWQLIRLFRRFAVSIAPAEIEDFFHPINRANWQGEFARWMEEQKGSTD